MEETEPYDVKPLFDIGLSGRFGHELPNLIELIGCTSLEASGVVQNKIWPTRMSDRILDIVDSTSAIGCLGLA